ncbi:transposase [Clostridium sp. VAP23]|uniref:transposase n=1 Tax=Clostridium sp. VAP23 TaxID=2949981 RepID=UPI00207AEE17
MVHRKAASGYEVEVTVYECESCENCSHKAKCTKAKANRKMQVSKTFVEKREIFYKNIITEKGASLLIKINHFATAPYKFIISLIF